MSVGGGPVRGRYHGVMESQSAMDAEQHQTNEERRRASIAAAWKQVQEEVAQLDIDPSRSWSEELIAERREEARREREKWALDDDA